MNIPRSIRLELICDLYILFRALRSIGCCHPLDNVENSTAVFFPFATGLIFVYPIIYIERYVCK
jgi:hypothetical protein